MQLACNMVIWCCGWSNTVYCRAKKKGALWVCLCWCPAFEFNNQVAQNSILWTVLGILRLMKCNGMESGSRVIKLFVIFH